EPAIPGQELARVTGPGSRNFWRWRFGARLDTRAAPQSTQRDAGAPADRVSRGAGVGRENAGTCRRREDAPVRSLAALADCRQWQAARREYQSARRCDACAVRRPTARVLRLAPQAGCDCRM